MTGSLTFDESGGVRHVSVPVSPESPVPPVPGPPVVPGLHLESKAELTLVHFSAQLERFVWDRGCA